MAEKLPEPDLIDRAKQGDEAALTELVERIQDRVFNLAMRMLGQPDDAEDATQEIVLRVVTHLGSFRREAAFTTWVHRIALNHLLRTREKSALEQARTFETFGPLIDQGVAAFQQMGAGQSEPEQVDGVLRNEVRLACTHGMLVCLDRDERAAFILGGILELSGAEASAILELEPATYRKRLSRARQRLETFMEKRCALYDKENPCLCERQVPVFRMAGQLNEAAPTYASLKVLGQPDQTAGDEEREFVHLMNTVKVIASQPEYAVTGELIPRLKSILARGEVV